MTPRTEPEFEKRFLAEDDDVLERVRKCVEACPCYACQVARRVSGENIDPSLPSLQCAQHVKGGGVCSLVATHRMFWPGHEPISVCEAHKKQALEIAEAMGFTLHMEPVR